MKTLSLIAARLSAGFPPEASTVVAIANRWAAKHPEAVARIARAIALVANVQPGDYSPRVFFVEGSEGHRYMVQVDRASRTSTCTCQDHAKGMHCKHRWAAALFEAGRAAESRQLPLF
jgi:hypothetical protein